mgnify:CR=1 FL=1
MYRDHEFDPVTPEEQARSLEIVTERTQLRSQITAAETQIAEVEAEDSDEVQEIVDAELW